MSAYRILLPLSKEDAAKELVTLAGHLLPEGEGQIDLMGVVAVPEGRSLSEAAVPAQETREILTALIRELPSLPLHMTPGVRVAHVPLNEVVSQWQDEPADLLLVPLHKSGMTALGAPLEEVLAHAPCDLILVRGVAHRYDRVLVPIRGGPHLALTLRLARALHRVTGQRVTLLTVTDTGEAPAALAQLQAQSPSQFQTLCERGDASAAIRRISADYHAVVLGSTLYEHRKRAALGKVPGDILTQTPLPVFLVRCFHPAGHDIPRLVNGGALPVKTSSLSDRVDRWFATNTFHWSEFERAENLLQSKREQTQTISLVLPTLNEEATIGAVIATIQKALMADCPLLDEIIVMDSDSTDRTREVAASLGVPVYVHQQVLTEAVGSYTGKGEALWKSLYVARGDIIAWIDTDIANVHPRFVLGILGPLLCWDRIQYVKGFYRRPLRTGGKTQLGGGGRVTELVARPFINLLFPELSGIVQPLSGEYAGRRRALESLPFFTGYGVESGLLVDLLEQFGLHAIAQCDLEVRTQDSQSLTNLSKMAFAIQQVFLSRLERRFKARLLEAEGGLRTMKTIRQEPGHLSLEEVEITEHERPPMATLAAYQARFPRL